MKCKCIFNSDVRWCRTIKADVFPGDLFSGVPSLIFVCLSIDYTVTGSMYTPQVSLSIKTLNQSTSQNLSILQCLSAVYITWRNRIFELMMKCGPHTPSFDMCSIVFSVNIGNGPICSSSAKLPYTSSSSSPAPCPLPLYLHVFYWLPSPHPYDSLIPSLPSPAPPHWQSERCWETPSINLQYLERQNSSVCVCVKQKSHLTLCPLLKYN